MSTGAAAVNPYLKTKILTASPAELRQMLLDGAVKFARQARDALGRSDFEASYVSFASCRNIVLELMSSMRPDADPDLCSRMTGLYTFIYTQLIEASHERSVEKVDKIIELLEYERETWSLLIERLRAGSESHLPNDTAPSAGSEQDGTMHRTLSVEG